MTEWRDTQWAGYQVSGSIAHGSFVARREKPVPATRARCQTCGRDYAPHKDGAARKHTCYFAMYDVNAFDLSKPDVSPAKAVGQLKNRLGDVPGLQETIDAVQDDE